jgi:hypothetical protein
MGFGDGRPGDRREHARYASRRGVRIPYYLLSGFAPIGEYAANHACARRECATGMGVQARSCAPCGSTDAIGVVRSLVQTRAGRSDLVTRLWAAPSLLSSILAQAGSPRGGVSARLHETRKAWAPTSSWWNLRRAVASWSRSPRWLAAPGGPLAVADHRRWGQMRPPQSGLAVSWGWAARTDDRRVHRVRSPKSAQTSEQAWGDGHLDVRGVLDDEEERDERQAVSRTQRVVCPETMRREALR